jgi:pyrroline-5-carboxylate reductase
MDAATVLALELLLRYIRASMQAGIEIRLANCFGNFNTNKGRLKCFSKKKSTPEQLIDRVTTPQGCTIAGLNRNGNARF